MKRNITTILSSAAVCLLAANDVAGFATTKGSSARTSPLRSEVAEATAETKSTNAIETDPKEAVKLFGRLAEKYIMLDASAGLCCYSACAGENEHEYLCVSISSLLLLSMYSCVN